MLEESICDRPPLPGLHVHWFVNTNEQVKEISKKCMEDSGSVPERHYWAVDRQCDRTRAGKPVPHYCCERNPVKKGSRLY